MYDAAPLGVMEDILEEDISEDAAQEKLQAILEGRAGDTAASLSVSGGGDTLVALQKRRRYGTALVAMQSFLAEEVGRQRKNKMQSIIDVEIERHPKATCVCATCVELRDQAWVKHEDPETGRAYYSNALSGVTQWVQPVLHHHKEVGIPKWLRSDHRGVADREIERLTTGSDHGGAFSPQRSRRSVDSKLSGKNRTSSSSPRGSKKGSPRGSKQGSPRSGGGQASPRHSMRSTGGGGGG